jgi:aryl-alcohol dehydrogenase-like predicted oxidoreductase
MAGSPASWITRVLTTRLRLPETALGTTGRHVTRFGLGGEGVLRTSGRDTEAAGVVGAALDLGVSYFDSARAYAGSESYYGRVWARDPAARARVFITSKSASRDARGARRDLATTLENLCTDHLDLWQLHDMRTEADLRAIAGRGGALEAFVAAKDAGLVRHIGVTGHHDPSILLRCVSEWPVETVLLPINPVEGVIGGFLTDVVPAARERKLGIIGMKVLGQGTLLAGELGLDPATLIRYALAQDADTLIVGCWSAAEVEQDVAVTARDGPLPGDQVAALHARLRPHARQLAYYRGRI